MCIFLVWNITLILLNSNRKILDAKSFWISEPLFLAEISPVFGRSQKNLYFRLKFLVYMYLNVMFSYFLIFHVAFIAVVDGKSHWFHSWKSTELINYLIHFSNFEACPWVLDNCSLLRIVSQKFLWSLNSLQV